MKMSHLMQRRMGAFRADLMFWIITLVALAVFGLYPTSAQAAPVLDGHIDDVVALANTYIQTGTGCGIIINDPAKEICLQDLAVAPCTDSLTTCYADLPYYVNGYDQILSVVALQGTDAWWGIRTAGGQIGDTDGDGTDGRGPCANGPQDPVGIGKGEDYDWDIYPNESGLMDIVVTVQGRDHHPTVIVEDSFGNPIPGVTGEAMYGTTDLEVHTVGLVLPTEFAMGTYLSSPRDGMTGDFAGPGSCSITRTHDSTWGAVKALYR